MHRVEQGLTIDNHHIVVYQQPPRKPESPEEKELNKRIRELEEQFHSEKQEEEGGLVDIT